MSKNPSTILGQAPPPPKAHGQTRLQEQQSINSPESFQLMSLLPVSEGDYSSAVKIRLVDGGDLRGTNRQNWWLRSRAAFRSRTYRHRYRENNCSAGLVHRSRPAFTDAARLIPQSTWSSN